MFTGLKQSPRPFFLLNLLLTSDRLRTLDFQMAEMGGAKEAGGLSESGLENTTFSSKAVDALGLGSNSGFRRKPSCDEQPQS